MELYRNLGQYKNAIISFRLKYRPYRSEYRILAGKWIPGRNKKTPLFCCRFLRNWRSLKKNKNRRSSWGFCESLKKKIHLSLQINQAAAAFHFSCATSRTFSSSFTSSKLLFPHFYFSLLYDFIRLWIILKPVVNDGKWKRQVFKLTFYPSRMVMSLTWPVDGIFFIPSNYVLVLVFD